MKLITDILKTIKRKRMEREYLRDRFSEPLFPRLINLEEEEKIYTSRDTRGFADMASKEFFTKTDLSDNGMDSCIEFDNAISSADEKAISEFLEIVVPDMQDELGIAFYGVSPKNRNLLLNAMSKRRAELILDNMLFWEKGVHRNKGKESINKTCKLMLDILQGKETTEEFKIEDFAVSQGDDPLLQLEHFILDAPEREIRRVLSLTTDSDLSVASYYFSDKAKDRLFNVIGDELTGLIKEDHSFMDNPSKRDVSEACGRIIKEFDVYWNM